MSDTTQTRAEEVPLTCIPGSGDEKNNSTTDEVITINTSRFASCSNNINHRKLAIFSIICGLSCIGITALINSVKAETTTDPERAAEFSQRAKKFGFISIGTWLAILISFPLLLMLVSYLLTLID
ncbi:uncharacterized protein V6R79_024215 [Siganus canaliculatus]